MRLAHAARMSFSAVKSYPSFELRPFQKEALDALKKPGHLICVAPTGSGKSLIYETLARHSRVLLITPLVALARQQHSRLAQLGIPAALAAGPDPEAPPETKSGAWILSPERLMHPSTRDKAASWKPEYLVVDECHCLWDWGERFRPSFTLIPEFLKTQNISRSIWLSATLPASAREQLRRELPSPLTEIGDFALPQTLHLSVQRTPWAARADRLLEFVARQTEPGIIFVQTRASAQRLLLLLCGTGKRCAIYHAEMASEERRLIEKRIEERDPEIIIATSAFGMGMDHPHLRWALLWQAPPSILALAQAVGRAGRDPFKKSEAVVFWDEEDFQLLKWMTQGSKRRMNELCEVRDFLLRDICRRQSLNSYFYSNHIDHFKMARCGQCDYCHSIIEI
jgi:ATP-dependent DNA helicase RecQ